MKSKIAILLISFLGIYSCNKPINPVDITEGDVTFTGNIENYQGIYKTGKLTYFDAVTRDIQDKIFTINSLGNFNFSIKLSHPLLNSIYFDVEGNYFSNFLVEPNTNYNISFIGSNLRFNGTIGKENNEISDYYKAINSVLGDKLSEAEKLHEKGLSIDEYINFQKQLELENFSFLNSYCEQNSISTKIKSILQSEIKFKTAHAIINYRFDYSNGFPMPRKSLPEEFYTNLFKEYPLQKYEDFQSRVCIDYLSNIVSVLSSEAVKADDKINYFKSFSTFSPSEIDMLSKLFSGDRSISKTEEFKDFLKFNEKNLTELNRRYNVQLLLKNIDLLGTDLTKELVISQGLTKFYFSNNLQPTVNEWEQIENKINNKSILNYLKKYSVEKTTTLGKGQDTNQETVINQSLEEVKSKYIDKYKGKVIYVDFYATWCGPCREEIPYAKQLYQEFKNKEIIFLNLCANSKMEDWENLKKQYELGGENYILTNEEFYLLSEIYSVKGFPTYILIDKKGDVTDYNALRPSAKKSLYEKIDELLNRE
jgi:thiol-disulfide isomerase/thioredoxin